MSFFSNIPESLHASGRCTIQQVKLAVSLSCVCTPLQVAMSLSPLGLTQVNLKLSQAHLGLGHVHLWARLIRMSPHR
jgi:hypothetical protein